MWLHSHSISVSFSALICVTADMYFLSLMLRIPSGFSNSPPILSITVLIILQPLWVFFLLLCGRCKKIGIRFVYTNFFPSLQQCLNRFCWKFVQQNWNLFAALSSYMNNFKFKKRTNFNLWENAHHIIVLRRMIFVFPKISRHKNFVFTLGFICVSINLWGSTTSSLSSEKCKPKFIPINWVKQNWLHALNKFYKRNNKDKNINWVSCKIFY